MGGASPRVMDNEDTCHGVFVAPLSSLRVATDGGLSHQEARVGDAYTSSTGYSSQLTNSIEPGCKIFKPGKSPDNYCIRSS